VTRASAITLMSQSFTGAQQVATTLPGDGPTLLMAAAKTAFTEGSNLAYSFGLLAVVGGLLLVTFSYPRKEQQAKTLEEYAQADQSPDTAPR